MIVTAFLAHVVAADPEVDRRAQRSMLAGLAYFSKLVLGTPLPEPPAYW